MTQRHTLPRSIANSLFFIALLALSPTPQALAQDNAELLMQLVPDQVRAGEQFTVVMQFRNTGTTRWSAARGYHLATRAKQRWGITKVALEDGEQIAPGETATFKFRATAPAGTGSHEFKWQMRRGSSWFGQPGSSVKINVADYKSIPDNADFVYQSVPAEMFTSQAYTAVLHFKNVGRTTWMPGRYHLAPVAADDGLIWAIDQIDLKKIVRPGEFYTFRFNIIAPATPGNYPFQWQIHHNGGGNFGDASPPLTIKVMAGM